MRTLSALLDPFMLALLATVALASVLPARGDLAQALALLSTIGIAFLFFLHGARLSRVAIVAGIVHWRLHVLVLASTFVMFPLIGIALAPLASRLLTADLAIGLLFLCALPSTVQSSIAFTSIAGGNVAAAVCSASMSSLLGVVLTPLLVAAMLSTQVGAGSPLDAIAAIALQLFAPFVVGHLSRPWTSAWITQRQALLSSTDRGTVLLVVYVAFSASVVEGLWSRVPLSALVGVFAFSGVMLVLALLLTTWSSRRFGFERADEIAIVFCGSKKSLATGVPIGSIVFAGNPALGMILLPVMVFHQLQLIACALLAQRYARSRDPR